MSITLFASFKLFKNKLDQYFENELCTKLESIEIFVFI